MPRRSAVRTVTTIGIDMGKNTLHMVGLDSLGAIVLRERVSRGRITSRPALLFTFLDLKCGSASSRAVPPV